MTMLRVNGAAKEFVLHAHAETRLPVFEAVTFEVSKGDCVALSGPSGVGKSTLMRMIYGNFCCPVGEILVWHGDDWVDIAAAHPHQVLDVRCISMGYVSQFLRVLPRVATLEIVMEPARAQGVAVAEAETRARELLRRLRVPERLWSLSPLTFSGGEQQRINLARGFAARYPLMLLDEPTASLDDENRATVIEMIAEARDAGTAMIGIFHDQAARTALCNYQIDMATFAARAA